MATMRIQVLSEQEIQAIHAASLAILRDTGILVPHDEVLGLLAGAGAHVDRAHNVAREAHFVCVAWFENPGDPRACPWEVHVGDTVRSPHSLDVADLDGDGELELVVGEHDPFKPYRSRIRLYVYKKADPRGRAWYRYPLDERFEHHDGTRVFEVAPGRLGIVSHGWADSRYVHLWEPV